MPTWVRSVRPRAAARRRTRAPGAAARTAGRCASRRRRARWSLAAASAVSRHPQQPQPVRPGTVGEAGLQRADGRRAARRRRWRRARRAPAEPRSPTALRAATIGSDWVRSIRAPRAAGGRARRSRSAAQSTDAASWPQAPSMSRPRVSRTVTGTPVARSRARTRARPAWARRPTAEPGVGFSGIRLTWRAAAAAQQLAEQVGPPRLVVDVADHRVLDRVPAPGARGVGVGRVRAPRPPSSGC